MNPKLVYFFLFLTFKLSSQEIYQRSFTKMGSDFELTIVADNPKSAEQLLAEGTAEIDQHRTTNFFLGSCIRNK